VYTPFRHLNSIFLKTRPIHLTFFVTRRCNSRCPFCFYLKSSESKASTEELSLDEIQKVSKSLGSLLWLAFSGGEIYLRDDLVEISKVFYKNNRPAIMLYPTNGLLPELIRGRTKEILMQCKKSVIAVKLSIDGLNEAHDKLRSTPHSFDKTMETYTQLEKLLEKYPNFELGVNTVFCSENQDSMERIIDFVSVLKNIKTHTISLIRGSLADESYKKIDYKKYLHSIKRLEKNLKKKTSGIYRFRGARIKAAQDVLQRNLIHRTLLEKKRLNPCYAGRLNLVLTESGDVYPCEILTERLGNLKDYEYDIREILCTEKARKVLTTIQDKKCFCTHECYFMTNILFNPKLYPALAKEYLQLQS